MKKVAQAGRFLALGDLGCLTDCHGSWKAIQKQTLGNVHEMLALLTKWTQKEVQQAILGDQFDVFSFWGMARLPMGAAVKK